MDSLKRNSSKKNDEIEKFGKSEKIVTLEIFRKMQASGEWAKINQQLIKKNYLDTVNNLSYEAGNEILTSYMDDEMYKETGKLWYEKYTGPYTPDSAKLYREILNDVFLNGYIIYLKDGEKVLDEYLSDFLQKNKNIYLKTDTIRLLRNMLDIYTEKIVDLIIAGKISFKKAEKELELAQSLGSDSRIYNMSDESLIIYFNELV